MRIRDTARARAEGESDFGLDLGEHASRRRRVASPYGTRGRRDARSVYCTPFCLDRQSRRSAGRRAVPDAGDRRQRSAHRVRAVGLGGFPVAPEAGRVPDIPDPRACVLIWRAGVDVT